MVTGFFIFLSNWRRLAHVVYMIYKIQWTNETLLYKNISVILFSKGTHYFLLVWEIEGETYTQRGNFFLSHTFFREPGGATLTPPCKPCHQRGPRRLWSAACPCLDSWLSTSVSLWLHTCWIRLGCPRGVMVKAMNCGIVVREFVLQSGYTPVGSEIWLCGYHMVSLWLHTCWIRLPRPLQLPCLLITTWQLIKAHGVTRNEPKIYLICYITLRCLGV